jgi:predicted nucleic acid-binding protein
LSPDDVSVSAVTLGELIGGVHLLPPGQQRRELELWLAEFERQFEDRFIPIDAEVARIWAETSARSQREGRPLPTVDGLIAATAIRHGLHVWTRNTRDFATSGALVFNPWED